MELASLLLDAGADPNAVNRNGATPLTLACTNANPALIERLLEAGADPSLAPNGEPPILGCARTGRVAALRAVLAYGGSGGRGRHVARANLAHVGRGPRITPRS